MATSHNLQKGLEMGNLQRRVRQAEERKGAGRCTQQITIIRDVEPEPPETCDCGGIHIIRVRVVYGRGQR